MSDTQIAAVEAYFLNLQESICAELEAEDGGASFVTDRWQREEGGGGCSRVDRKSVV